MLQYTNTEALKGDLYSVTVIIIYFDFNEVES